MAGSPMWRLTMKQPALRLFVSCSLYLPQNNLEDPPLVDEPDPADRMEGELDSLAEATDAKDVREIIGHVVDKDSLLELLPLWGKAVVVGFARLAGRPVGVVANQATEAEGRLEPDAAAKSARFVRLCDAFNVPVVAFVDTPGFVNGEGQAHGRMLREGAKLMYAFAEATVPKLSVITGRALAEGYEVMCSKHLGADLCFAWPAATIAASSSGQAELSTAYAAAQAGHLDDVIEPATTRPRLIAALEACASKRESRPAKKHGNIPLRSPPRSESRRPVDADL